MLKIKNVLTMLAVYEMAEIERREQFKFLREVVREAFSLKIEKEKSECCQHP